MSWSTSVPSSVSAEAFYSSHITIGAENDKNSVIALREIAEKTIAPRDMREGLIHSIQGNVEIDEPEPGAAPTHPLRPMAWSG